jgi:hypothetical protein
MPRDRDPITSPPQEPPPAEPRPAAADPRDAQADDTSDELLGEKSDYVIIGGEPP